MRLRLLATHYHGSRPGLDVPWAAGEERELDADTAAYVLDTFPGMAEVVVEDGASVAEVVSAPPADRAMRAPRRRRA